MRDATVTFWTEGGHSIGMGRVSRCAAIAAALERASGLKSSFFVNADAPTARWLRGVGFECAVRPLDSMLTLGTGSSVVVIDTEREVGAHVRRLRGAGRKVVLLDNDGPSVEADAAVFGRLGAGTGRRADERVGAEYAAIGANFLAAARRKRGGDACKPLNLIVTMGGGDRLGLTWKTVEALTGSKGLDVTVVIGPAAALPADYALIAARAGGSFRFVRNSRDLAQLAERADAAITALGLTVYELAYLGVPSVVIGKRADDAPVLDELRTGGYGISLGIHDAVGKADIIGAVEKLRDGARLSALSERAMALTDGRGAERIAGIISSLAGKGPAARTTDAGASTLRLRRAVEADSDTLLRWRNDPVTRAQSVSTAEVKRDEHEAWFSRTLSDPAVTLYVAECDDGPVGTVRVDERGGVAELSWTVSPEARGRGVGKAMVKLAAAALKGAVKARIRTGNAASISIARSAGFVLESEDGELGLWRLAQ